MLASELGNFIMTDSNEQKPREWKLSVHTVCQGHGDYGKVYYAEPKEFNAYMQNHLINKNEVWDVIEKSTYDAALARIQLLEQVCGELREALEFVVANSGLSSDYNLKARNALASVKENLEQK